MTEEMTRETIGDRIQAYFEKEFPNPGVELTKSMNLLQDWLIDSFGIVQTTIFLEQEFGVEVQRGDITAENFQNIDCLAGFVLKSLKGE